MLRADNIDAERFDYDRYQHCWWHDGVCDLYLLVWHTGRIWCPIVHLDRSDLLPLFKCFLGPMLRQRKRSTDWDPVCGF